MIEYLTKVDWANVLGTLAVVCLIGNLLVVEWIRKD